SKQETLRWVRTAEPVPPRRLRPETPGELEAVCLKCLRKDPGERYPTAQALADDLRAWLEGRRPKAWAGGGGQDWLGRRPRLSLVALAVLGAVLVGLALGERSWAPSGDGSGLADPPRKHKVLIGEKGVPGWREYRMGGPFVSLAANRE